MRAVFRDNRIFIYDAFVQKESIKEIPGRLWHPKEKAWSVPFGADNIETLDLLGCELSSELRKMKKEYVCEGLEEPQTFISAPLTVTLYAHQLMANMIIKIIDLESEVKTLKSLLEDKKAEALSYILRLEDDEYQTLLILRYLQLMNWEEISKEMHYSKRWLYKMHGTALVLFSAILNS